MDLDNAWTTATGRIKPPKNLETRAVTPGAFKASNRRLPKPAHPQSPTQQQERLRWLRLTNQSIARPVLTIAVQTAQKNSNRKPKVLGCLSQSHALSNLMTCSTRTHAPRREPTPRHPSGEEAPRLPVPLFAVPLFAVPRLITYAPIPNALIIPSAPGVVRRSLAAITAFSFFEAFSRRFFHLAYCATRFRRRRSSLCRSLPAINFNSRSEPTFDSSVRPSVPNRSLTTQYTFQYQDPLQAGRSVWGTIRFAKNC